MTDDLVKRLRDMCGKFGVLYSRDIYDTDVAEAADRIEWMQDIIARIQYTNLRQDINAESRTIEIEKLCKGKPNEQR
jgi:hypothetical protein